MRQVLTFDFERKMGDDPDSLAKLWSKLDEARARKSIVCTTAEALKSMFLKYLDLMYSLANASDVILAVEVDKQGHSSGRRGRNKRAMSSKTLEQAKLLKRRQRSACIIARIMRMWGAEEKGILLMDEVDLLLHPLRSELNFPVRLCWLWCIALCVLHQHVPVESRTVLTSCMLPLSRRLGTLTHWTCPSTDGTCPSTCLTARSSGLMATPLPQTLWWKAKPQRNSWRSWQRRSSLAKRTVRCTPPHTWCCSPPSSTTTRSSHWWCSGCGCGWQSTLNWWRMWVMGLRPCVPPPLCTWRAP